MFYISFMITTKQKPVTDTLKAKREESKHITTEKSSSAKGRDQEKKEQRNCKMARK